MSSLRRVQSSQANGALSKGPSTPAGKLRSSQNAVTHGLCATCLVLDDESREHFLTLLQQHVDRFRPADEVEQGMIEEMTAACWRQRRAWSIETRMFNTHMARSKDGDALDRMVDAVEIMAAAPSLSLLQRYENRQHLMYQRALRTFILVRGVKIPNDPSPISEHPPVVPLVVPRVGQASRPVVLPVVPPVSSGCPAHTPPPPVPCSPLTTAPAPNAILAKPPAPPPAMAPGARESGGAA
ncbi:MAG: hypothetical protein ABSG03_30860 [Bryobacteraceae bacterium]|jgi:hypothetical protein